MRRLLLLLLLHLLQILHELFLRKLLSSQGMRH